MFKNMTLEEKIQLALENSQRALDYFEIQKVWAAHGYCYRAQQQRYELENYWAKEHDDIMYAHGTAAFEGRDVVMEYYAGGNEKMNRGKLELMHKLFPEVELKDENLGIGDLVVRLQTSPYIEIAKDGMTAKGLWYTLGYNIEPDVNGELDQMVLLAKESVDFVRERDGWKIWHFRDSTDIMNKVEQDIFGLAGRGGPGGSGGPGGPGGPDGPPGGLDEPPKSGGRTINGCFPNPNKFLYPFAEDGPFSVRRVAKFAPDLPQAYDKWDDSISYSRAKE